MRREFSAGGVVARRLRGHWHLAAIQPAGKAVWVLPKGLVGPDERAAEAAVREVAEETGLETHVVEKLGDVRYVYTWEGERVFKIVSFFLLSPVAGRIGRLPPEHAHEVAAARWLPLADAPGILAYRGEREMAALALATLTRGAAAGDRGEP